MEEAFAADFGRVKIHTDGEADRLSRSLGARAFTSGGDQFFRRGEYAPSTPAGRETLAHELAHVLQQGDSGSSLIQRKVGFEYETGIGIYQLEPLPEPSQSVSAFLGSTPAATPAIVSSSSAPLPSSAPVEASPSSSSAPPPPSAPSAPAERYCIPFNVKEPIWIVPGLFDCHPDGALLEFRTEAFEEDAAGRALLVRALR